MDTVTDVFARQRQEVRYSLHGRTREAVDRLTSVYARWVARIEAAEGPDIQARAAAYLAECQRIAELMQARSWDVYRMGDDNEAH